MPITRTYACPDCNHMIEVVLPADQWDAEAPVCPACAQRAMRQDFRPVAIGGSARAQAVAIAEEIAANDYHVADMKVEGHEGHAPKVRYKDQVSQLPASAWTAAQSTIAEAIAAGRETRLRYGNGLDVLQSALKTGAQPDLIAESKKRAIRVW